MENSSLFQVDAKSPGRLAFWKASSRSSHLKARSPSPACSDKSASRPFLKWNVLGSPILLAITVQNGAFEKWIIKQAQAIDW